MATQGTPSRFILKHSDISGAIPDVDTLSIGELAINIADGVIFYKDKNNNLKTISVELTDDLLEALRNDPDTVLIEDIFVNEDYELVIDFEGTTRPTYVSSNLKGATGTGLTLLNSVNYATELPTIASSPPLDPLYQVTGTLWAVIIAESPDDSPAELYGSSHVWLYNKEDDEWSDIGALTGAPGFTGATGPAGPPGGGANTLNELNDVDVPSPTDGYVLTYSSSSPTGWVAASPGALSEINDLTASVTWANVPNANITQSSVTQHVGAIDHDSLLNFVANEHIDWTANQSPTVIDVNNIPSTLLTETAWNNAGDLVYATGNDIGSILSIGSEGQVLTVNSGLPSWQNAGGGGSSTLAGLTDTDIATVDPDGSPAGGSGDGSGGYPDPGDVLTWDDIAEKWIAAPAPAVANDSGTVQGRDSTYQIEARQADDSGSGPQNANGAYSVNLQTKTSSPLHVASGQYSVISGGSGNTAEGNWSTVAGGEFNKVASGHVYSTVSGGYLNVITGDHCSIAGGGSNTIDGTSQYNFIGGGELHDINSSSYSSVSGGYNCNILNSSYAAIIGGQNCNIGTGGGSIGSIVGGYRAGIGGNFDGCFVFGDYSTGAANSYPEFHSGISGYLRDNAAYFRVSGGMFLNGYDAAFPSNDPIGAGSSLYIEERLSGNADVDVAGHGQIWVKNDTPNTLWFTDDTGVDHQISDALSLTSNDSPAPSFVSLDQGNQILTVDLVPVGDISATGTPDGTTFLRGDGQWVVPTGQGGTRQGTDRTYDLQPANEGITAGTTLRGENSVDLQTERSGGDQVASGANSVIIGGKNNKCVGPRSTIAGGSGNSTTNGAGTETFIFGTGNESNGSRCIIFGDKIQNPASGTFVFSPNYNSYFNQSSDPVLGQPESAHFRVKNGFFVHGFTNGGKLYLEEYSGAGADAAGFGQIWVKSAVPNQLWFTDDAGGDHQLTGPEVAPHDALTLTSNDSPAPSFVSLDEANQILTVDEIPVADISATGTPDGTTFLRGDGQWATPASPTTLTLAYTETAISYVVLTTDYTVNATAADITITLPTAVGIQGQIFVIKNSSTGEITLDGDGSETIDGSLTATMPTLNSLTVQSTGSNWIII